MLSEVPLYFQSDPTRSTAGPAVTAPSITTEQLSDLPLRTDGVVQTVNDVGSNDVIAARLRELGFVRGEPVRVVARGPFGADPLLILIGYTRFALRRSEAARVQVSRA